MSNWRAKMNEPYWYIYRNEVLCKREVHSVEDDSYYANGNYFESKEEALYALNKKRR